VVGGGWGCGTRYLDSRGVLGPTFLSSNGGQGGYIDNRWEYFLHGGS